MIPVLFEKNTTEFTTLGIGALTDCISCTVRRVLNGMDELEMSYPETGIRANELLNSRIIRVVPEWDKSAQSYRIYDITKPLNGIFYVYARHVSEQKTYIPVMPFEASSASNALASISDNCAEACPFTFWTDKQTVADFKLSVPASLGNVLGGMAGSILDVYGGEYEFDDYTVKLWNRRGADRGVTLRYGKNITDIQQEESIDATITGICPFWSDLDGDLVVLPEKVVRSTNAQNFPFNRTIAKDFSDRFDEKPTVAQLRSVAEAYVSQPTFGVPDVSIKVSFEMLSQYKEYEQLASLESVNLGDTVHVIFEKLNINADARVVETRYDVLNNRYKSISVGRVKSNMSSVVAGIEGETNANIQQTKTSLELAIENATSQLTGADGGYLVDTFDLNGNRTGDMLMDTNDPATATNVWLRNIAGWGHSSSGVNGPYTTAITQDGKIVADFILAGTLQGITIIGEDGKIGGWNMTASFLDKITSGSTKYRLRLYAPNNASENTVAILAGEGTGTSSAWTWVKENFKVTYGGALIASKATINGDSILSIGEVRTIQGSDYSQTDLDRITQIIMGSVTPTDADYERLDVDRNGVINLLDRTIIQSAINNGTATVDLTVVIDASGNSSQFIKVGATNIGTRSIETNDVNAVNVNASGNVSADGTIRASGDVYANNHSSPIGTVLTSTKASSDISVGTSSTTMASLELTPGIWIVNGYVKFNSTSTAGRRMVNIASSGSQANARIKTDCPIITGSAQQLECGGYLNVSSLATYYLNASSSVAGTADKDYTQMTAIRIQ